MGNRLTVAAALVGSLAGAGGVWAQAAETAEQRMARLEARVQSLESELRSYREAASADQAHCDAQRQAVIAETVEKVLSDAQRRSSLLAIRGGARVGYAGGFFLADQDNKFQAKLNGLLQPRFIYNHNDSSSEDNNELGFQVQRSELYLTGNVFSPQVFWQFSGGFNNSSGGFNIVSAYAGYQFSKTTEVRAGTFKPPFLIEELTAAGRQQAVERSLLNSLFTAGTSEGVQVQHARERYRVAVMLHDGTNATATNFASDRTDFAIVARGEWKLAGQWSQFADFEGWNDSAFAARLGGAVDYEFGETGDGSDNPDFVKYTLDLTVKSRGWNLLLVGVGRNTEQAGASDAFDQYGLLVQGGVFIIPNRAELFARYELIELDGVFSSTAAAIDDQLNIITVGMNWFCFAHNLKLTTDVMYLFDQIPAGNTFVGLLASDDGPQWVIRTGLSLMF